MSETRRLNRPECEEVLNELEKFTAVGRTAGEVSLALTEASRRHAQGCEECGGAIEDFVATHWLLAPMKDVLPQEGPWFAARVMAAVRAAENEMEEKREGLWISVRRLAPRLMAFAALLLVLGGTWAMEVRRREMASGQTQMRQAEGLFESTPSTPWNDDIVASAAEGSRP